ncbi:PaaI family thioesterase [Halorubrum sp. CBA1229]|uniref:PaaI family thioesterase n=1 Tax=Halorubrum sp. CBA1229 TaxID=1853699 RepID=UPI000F3C8C6B|nr:PaaI family thioesterase [Halorubrum sp. CBA1229]QKY17461.1 PaaI family thioesterase [Halorubrum sp. CBA1229]
MNRTDVADLDPLSAEAVALVERRIEEEHGYLSWLNTSVDVVERGRVVLSIPFDDKLTNSDGGTIHGGVAATLIDTAGGIVQRTAFEDPLSGEVATVNLNASYLRPATGDLTAEATIVRSGGSIGVSDMTVTSATNGEAAEVVVGQGSFRLFRE